MENKLFVVMDTQEHGLLLGTAWLSCLLFGQGQAFGQAFDLLRPQFLSSCDS